MASPVANRSSPPSPQSFRVSSSPLLSDGPVQRSTNVGATQSSSLTSSPFAAGYATTGPSVLNRPRPGQGGRKSVDVSHASMSSMSSSNRPSTDSERERAQQHHSPSGHSQSNVLGHHASGHALQQTTHHSNSESDETEDEMSGRHGRQGTARRNSFFGIAANARDRDEDDVEVEARTAAQMRSSSSSSYGALGDREDEAASSSRPSTSSDRHVRDERRSSFYGLDGHLDPSQGLAGLPSNGIFSSYEPTPYNSSTNAYAIPQRQAHPYYHQHRAAGGDSGSGSYSSHELRSSGGTATTSTSSGPAVVSQVGAQGTMLGQRIYSAPYAASRAASLHLQPGLGGAPSIIEPSPSSQRLLSDQSHLQPGSMASLLSHEKTLDLYRANAKKTDDPDIQFELCTFTMELVAEMEAISSADRLAPAESGFRDASGAVTTGASSPVAATSNVLTKENKENSAPGSTDLTSRAKQQELVAESVTLLNKLATRGHVKSQYFLADCYTQGVGTAKGRRDYDKAFPLFMLAGKHGHSDACFRAAQCCENAWGTKKDFSKAVTLLRRAAVLNHPGAMHRLGIAELNGEMGLARRPREGVKWLKRAAELADQVDPPQPQSLHELAVLHEKGIENVIFKDEEYAAELLARASELQFAPSAYKLGECYEYGKMGCPQDAALSIHYYNIAAQQGHPEACFALTAWYLVGSPGVLPQSDTEAYLWARKAAAFGLAKAEYSMGIGTYKDAREAIDWFRKAAGHGDKRAIDRLRMTGTTVETMYGRPPPQARELPPPAEPAGSYKPPVETKMKTRTLGNRFGVGKREGLSIHIGGRSASAGQPSSAVEICGQPSAQEFDAALRAVHNAGRPDFPRQRSVSQPATSTDPYQPHSRQRQNQQVDHSVARPSGPPTPPKMPETHHASWGRSGSPMGRGSSSPSNPSSPSRGGPLPGRGHRPYLASLDTGAQPPSAHSRMLPPGAAQPRLSPSTPVELGGLDRALPFCPPSPSHTSSKTKHEPNVLTKKVPNSGPTSQSPSAVAGKGFWKRK
ncbi:BQ2448_6517 [Microbotryum intermedium]|uniref:BQ2448_6517 protein n=1 Tax=Microbotryum intermedium TaxID=269621 RepID=A0A238FLQ1_9BASI|nr:BQ2448_6517 [Microbotryum intermedium]